MTIYFNIAFQILSIFFAFLAAWYWYKSSKVECPSHFIIHVVEPRLKPLVLDGKYVGQGQSTALSKLGDSLIQQSKLNSKGAMFAALAAISQAIVLLVAQLFPTQ